MNRSLGPWAQCSRPGAWSPESPACPALSVGCPVRRAREGSPSCHRSFGAASPWPCSAWAGLLWGWETALLGDQRGGGLPLPCRSELLRNMRRNEAPKACGVCGGQRIPWDSQSVENDLAAPFPTPHPPRATPLTVPLCSLFRIAGQGGGGRGGGGGYRVTPSPSSPPTHSPGSGLSGDQQATGREPVSHTCPPRAALRGRAPACGCYLPGGRICALLPVRAAR